MYKEALALAQSAGDEEAVEQIQEGLKEVGNRRKAQKQPRIRRTDQLDQLN